MWDNVKKMSHDLLINLEHELLSNFLPGAMLGPEWATKKDAGAFSTEEPLLPVSHLSSKHSENAEWAHQERAEPA